MDHLPQMFGEQDGKGRAIFYRIVISRFFVPQKRFLHLLRSR